MGIRRPLGFAVVAFGILAGCSKNADAPRDVAPLPTRGAPSRGVDAPALSESALAELRKQPITTSKDEVGELLARWWKEGVAAGNVGDHYDNRDEAHSDLDTKAHPQLQRVVYSADEVKEREHLSLKLGVRPAVTFGNSSRASATRLGGSIPRTAYGWPEALALLAEQYRGNNLYIYPECGDHRPGHNGLNGGYGDLYPTNTPYLIISQGYSYSDQPFLRAVALTLAAFRPEVKRKLTEHGLLMPTLQMILRSTSKKLATPKDYLTGKAHPTVFEGASIDVPRMVELAHQIAADAVPPLVRLEVVEEDVAENGRDFFEPPGITETLASTPQAIARIWRGQSGRRRMVVSAAGSTDLNKKPLTYTWAVLRGDGTRVRITPRNEAGSEVEIVVPYHPRRPVTPGAALESNRVDIGVFAHNGTYHSAPGFVTYYTLDNESRAHDEKGRPLEVGYGAGDVDLRVTDYDALLRSLSDAGGPAAGLFDLTDTQRAALKDVTERHHLLRAELKKNRSDLDEYEARSKDAEAKVKEAQAEVGRTEMVVGEKPSPEARSILAAAKKKADEAAARFKAIESAEDAAYEKKGQLEEKVGDLLAAKRDPLGGSVDEFVSRKLRQLSRDSGLFGTHEKMFLAGLEKADAARRKVVEAARGRLVQAGLATTLKGGRGITPFARQLAEGFNAALLSELVLPGALSVSSAPNFVSQYYCTAKSWRDVYRYDARGDAAGWTRYDATGVSEFTEQGLIVLEKDDAGRPIKARTVLYTHVAVKDPAEPDGLEMSPGGVVVSYAYEDGKRVEKSRTLSGAR